MGNTKKDIRLNIRVPQYLKDKIAQEAEKKNMTQSEFVRNLITIYFFEHKEQKEVTSDGRVFESMGGLIYAKLESSTYIK